MMAQPPQDAPSHRRPHKPAPANIGLTRCHADTMTKCSAMAPPPNGIIQVQSTDVLIRFMNWCDKPCWLRVSSNLKMTSCSPMITCISM